MTARSVMILAGGTGGHVYPGIAVAEALRRRGCDLHWMGTLRGLESRVVPAHDIPFATVRVAGLRRTGVLRWLLAPVTLSVALLQALGAIARVRPSVVLGMGGFVSGPGGVAAWLCRRPLVIHEQNALPGLTNRCLSRIARRVLEAFPGSFPPSVRAVATGNPVRPEIAALDPPDVRLEGRSGLRLLVFGGSRGARALNESVPAAAGLARLGALEVRHQCGADALEGTRARYAEAGVAADVEPFIEDMAAAYAWADLVVARAGAITIAELAAAGVAAILVPYPHAVDDHQTANARYLTDADAAVLLPEPELTPETLAGHLRTFAGDRGALVGMATRARALALPEATERVASHCLELIDV